MSRGWLGIGVVIPISALLMSGCGEAAAKIERTVSASGVLTHRGQPLAYYQVLFVPAEGQRPAAGISDEHGKFVLGTNGAGDGAVAGKHRVAVVYVGPPSAKPDAGQNDFSPPPPPKVKIAAKYQQPETSGLTLDIPNAGTSELKIELP